MSSSRCHDPPSETDVKTSPDALKAKPRNWPLPGGQQENTDISNKYRARTKGRAFFDEMDLVAGYGSEDETATVSVTLPELIL